MQYEYGGRVSEPTHSFEKLITRNEKKREPEDPHEHEGVKIINKNALAKE